MRECRRYPFLIPLRLATGLTGILIAIFSRATGAQLETLDSTLERLGYAKIELRRTGENHLFLFGRLNGRRCSCLVDTGWSFTTASPTASRRLNRDGIVNELRLGRVRLRAEPMRMQDLRVNGQPTPYEVVLGCDFLIRHHALIDCAGPCLYLRSTALAEELASQLNSTLQQLGRRSVKLTQPIPEALTCMASVDGSRVELLVDTGAMWSCLDTETARALHLPIAPSANQIMGPAAGGRRSMGVASVRSFEMGDLKSARLSFGVLALADWGLGTHGAILNRVGGILGGDELARRAAIIDCSQLQLWQSAQRVGRH